MEGVRVHYKVMDSQKNNSKRDKELAHKLLHHKKKRWTHEERLAELRKLNGIVREDCFYKVVEGYIKGKTTLELAKEFHYSQDKIIYMIEEHYRDLVNAKEAHALCITSKEGYNPVFEKLMASEVMTENFLALLSPPEACTLTEEEALFSWIYVHKGDSIEAIEASGLQIGLFADRPVTYKRGVLTRSLYLQNKANIAAYIKELREKKYYTEDITKQYVQELLLEQIAQMKLKGDKRDAVNLRQTIELLGKTIGAFTEKIEIHEVDPSRSLDLLIEMAKTACVSELPPTSVEELN
jgi:hypothetical protein